MSTKPQRDPFRQQFEQRMRLRRATTCVAAARVAITEGRLVDAQERLDEAMQLDPENGEAPLLMEELRSLEAGVSVADARTAERPHEGGWGHWVAVAVAITALAALAVLLPDRPDSVRRAAPARPAPASPSAPVPSLPSPPALAETPPPESELDAGNTRVAENEASTAPQVPNSSENRPIGTSGNDNRPPARAENRPEPPAGDVPPRAAERSASASRSEPPTEIATERLPATSGAPNPGVTAPPPVAAAPPERMPDRTAERVSDLRPVVGGGAEARVPVPAAAPPEPAPPAEAVPAGPRPDPEAEAVQHTLQRYADAYGRLDARAARAVWPSVDEAALARAFEGLESQGLQFDRCEVSVAGSEAVANCTGRASYVRKVGNREPLTESRRWTFRLRRAGEAWHIVRAEAR